MTKEKNHKTTKQGAKPDFRIFRDVRMEPVLVSLFIGRKLPLGTHTADLGIT